VNEKEAINRESRAAEKAASRQADRIRIASGENPSILQRENSIFPSGYFENHRILNLSTAIGR